MNLSLSAQEWRSGVAAFLVCSVACTEVGKTIGGLLMAGEGLGTTWDTPMQCVSGGEVAVALEPLGLDAHDVFYDYPLRVGDSAVLRDAWTRTQVCVGDLPASPTGAWKSGTMVAIVLDDAVGKVIYTWVPSDRDAMFAEMRDNVTAELGDPVRRPDGRLRWALDSLRVELSPYSRVPGGAPQLTVSTARACRWFDALMVRSEPRDLGSGEPCS